MKTIIGIRRTLITSKYLSPGCIPSWLRPIMILRVCPQFRLESYIDDQLRDIESVNYDSLKDCLPTTTDNRNGSKGTLRQLFVVKSRWMGMVFDTHLNRA